MHWHIPLLSEYFSRIYLENMLSSFSTSFFFEYLFGNFFFTFTSEISNLFFSFLGDGVDRKGVLLFNGVFFITEYFFWFMLSDEITPELQVNAVNLSHDMLYLMHTHYMNA